MKLVIVFILGIFITPFFGVTLASDQSRHSIELSHSGGTDKCGCHTKSSTGEYHCHTRKQRGGDCPA